MAAFGSSGDEQWTMVASETPAGHYRLCDNYKTHDICNWAVPADDGNPLCQSCRLTRVLPNLEVEGNREKWAKLEASKRRMLYTLLDLGLPIVARAESSQGGLAFEFRSPDMERSGKVSTGHDDGLITINVAEADDAEREKRRLRLHEPYRTVLGHFRHEVGHYYWDVLIRDSDRLAAFREEFGDERVDYSAALKKHYESPAPDWAGFFVSAYASSHPWEDWAETWAHYMHLLDSLETAAACGVRVEPRRPDEPRMQRLPVPDRVKRQPFDLLLDQWHSLTYVLNNLSRSLGQADSYPYVLPKPAIDKLRFVHDVVLQTVGTVGAPSSASRPANDPTANRSDNVREADLADGSHALAEGLPSRKLRRTAIS